MSVINYTVGDSLENLHVLHSCVLFLSICHDVCLLVWPFFLARLSVARTQSFTQIQVKIYVKLQPSCVMKRSNSNPSINLSKNFINCMPKFDLRFKSPLIE